MHQLFVDLQVLIESQGYKIDTICDNLDLANDYMDKATLHLHKAKRYDIKMKKVRTFKYHAKLFTYSANATQSYAWFLEQ